MPNPNTPSHFIWPILGRHLVIVATKGTGGVEDRRPSDSERESSDSHVHTLSTAMK